MLNGVAVIAIAIQALEGSTDGFLTRAYTVARKSDVDDHFTEIVAIREAVQMISRTFQAAWVPRAYNRLASLLPTSHSLSA